jgi:hypothetical protein
METIARHDTMREGARLGLLVATAIWIWLALIDALVGQPWHTFTVLGGIAGFTTLHYGLNIVGGIAVMAVIHASEREPSLIIAVTFGGVIAEGAAAMATVLLSHLGLGELAWVRIFGGSLVGTSLAIVLLARGHPLAATLRRAERE